MAREFISSSDLIPIIADKLEDVSGTSMFLINKIIDLYLEEKQKHLEAGKAVMEGNTATQYQIRFFNTNDEGDKQFTVKIQGAFEPSYKDEVVKAINQNKQLFEAYSDCSINKMRVRLKMYKQQKDAGSVCIQNK